MKSDMKTRRSLDRPSSLRGKTQNAKGKNAKHMEGLRGNAKGKSVKSGDVATATAMVRRSAGTSTGDRSDGSTVASWSAFMDFAQRTGLTFPITGGKFQRDVWKALGFPRKLTIKDYRGQYERGGIASRIVEAYPKATWGGSLEVIEVEDETVLTTFEIKAAELVERLDLWNNLLRADILAGIGQYSVLFIGAPGDMKSPIGTITAEQVLYVRPVWQENARIKSYNENFADPRCGQPEIYEIKFDGITSREVHWSRVIHIVDGALEDQIWGKPRLRACWNDLMSLEKIVGGGAEAAWKRMDPGLQIDVDPTIVMSDDELDLLDEEVDNFTHGLERTIRTRGTKVTPLAASVALFKSNAESLIDLIAGTTEIPQRILLGSESGKLASEQDSDNWYSRVMERRRVYADPTIRRVFQRFIEIGALAAPASKMMIVRWVQTEKLNEAQKSAIVSSLANANSAQVNAEGRLLLTSSEIRARVLNLGPLPEKDATPKVKPGTPNDNGSGSGAIDPEDTEEGIDAGPTQRQAREITETSVVTGVAEKNMSRVAGIALAMWATVASSVSGAKLEEMLGYSDHHGAEKLIIDQLSETEDHYQAKLEVALNRIQGQSGAAVLQLAVRRDSWYDTAVSRDDSDVAALARADFPMEFDVSNPRAVAWARIQSAALVTEINEGTRRAIRSMIAKGLRDGIPPKRLATLILQRIGLREDQVTALENFAETGASTAQISKYAKKLLRDRANLIAKTEVANAANQGQKELWLQARDDGYLGRDQKRKWIGTPDGRERDAHVFINGQIRGLSEPFRKSDGTAIEPGQEPNCILPGAIIEGSVVGGLKASYAGPAVEIETARGHRISLTVNHPVLTSQGWVAAGALQEGMNLLSCETMIESAGVPSGPHDNHSPAAIEDVFETISLRGLRSTRVIGSDLHGDAKFVEGDIDIVSPERELVPSGESFGSKEVSHLNLPESDVLKSSLASSSAGEHHAQGILLPASSDMSSGNLSSSNIGMETFESGPFRDLRFGLAADWDIVKPESTVENTTADAAFFGELIDRSSGAVSSDKVLKVRNFDFRGHVFDLQTAVGWMLANGIVLSNCRCGQGLARPSEVAAYNLRKAS